MDTVFEDCATSQCYVLTSVFLLVAPTTMYVLFVFFADWFQAMLYPQFTNFVALAFPWVKPKDQSIEETEARRYLKLRSKTVLTVGTGGFVITVTLIVLHFLLLEISNWLFFGVILSVSLVVISLACEKNYRFLITFHGLGDHWYVNLLASIYWHLRVGLYGFIFFYGMNFLTKTGEI